MIHKTLIQDDYIEEIFFNDELYCSFCIDMERVDGEDNYNVLPSCNKCTGFVYAMKSKIYFVVN